MEKEETKQAKQKKERRFFVLTFLKLKFTLQVFSL